MKIICMIPARLGSKRIKNKNIRYLKDKPLIEYIVQTAKKTKIFNQIFINSEDIIFESIAKRNKINFYKRNPILSSDKATNDDFVLDFLKNIKCDYLIQLLPTSPFLTINEINNFVKHIVKNKLDTLVSVKNIKIECIYNNKAINFKKNEKTPPSQFLTPIQAYACGIMGWKTKNFILNMKKFNSAYHGGAGKIDYFELKGLSNIDIDNEEDFQLAERILGCYFKNKKKRYYKTNQFGDYNRLRILNKDGVSLNIMNGFNKKHISISKIIKSMPKNKSWSKTIINSISNSATLIAQMPREGNRLHFHPDWDEWWYILKGKWKWEINKKFKIVRKGDVIYIKRNQWHQITAIGKKMAIRLAVSRADVEHVYKIN